MWERNIDLLPLIRSPTREHICNPALCPDWDQTCEVTSKQLSLASQGKHFFYLVSNFNFMECYFMLLWLLILYLLINYFYIFPRYHFIYYFTYNRFTICIEVIQSSIINQTDNIPNNIFSSNGNKY